MLAEDLWYNLMKILTYMELNKKVRDTGHREKFYQLCSAKLTVNFSPFYPLSVFY